MKAATARQMREGRGKRTRGQPRPAHPEPVEGPPAIVADSVEARADAYFARIDEEVRRTGKPVQLWPHLGPPILDDDD